MEWTDDGIVLSVRPHGETAAIIHVLTPERGRHAGLVQGGQGRKARAIYQPGNRLVVTWSGRLADNLGSFKCELETSHAARLLDQPRRLTALTAAAAICERALPEREAHPACFHGFLALLDALEGDHWAEIYVRWELGLLADLGFGLDLSACAAGGDNDQLAYVSPRTGRAVSLAAGEPYRDRLLPLPPFLIGRGAGGPEEVAQGLQLSSYFLERSVFHLQDRPLPPARERLAALFPLPGQDDDPT
ncbi:DNA repair protein RecO [Denitrobaculum tricleocarpae]|uniref:DNA repair protein RecO n=1 Tax=Denitrobaculum tricleocarpae TaxID=2591009 RepID=A0A545TUQ7_9PROT|nr:DNA repair protein RecO [Denitrobaculum tricleocarpae]TQV80954.1 DNA repair protein RecO [Denitrobaculum tricleocarpae]